MKITFFHYHLKTGGVTTVLRGQVAAIREVCDTLVITGDRAGTAWPCEVVEIPEIGYDRPDSPPHAPQPVADKIWKAIWILAGATCARPRSTLAKNRCFLQDVEPAGAVRGSLFFYNDDFAEDGRNSGASSVSYLRTVITASSIPGIARSSSEPGSTLPESAPGSQRHPAPADRKAPSRTARPLPDPRHWRKNLGEAILLLVDLQNGQRLDVSQPPNSSQDIASYRAWKRYVKEKRLNLNFDVGQKVDFFALVGAAGRVDRHREHCGGIRFPFCSPGRPDCCCGDASSGRSAGISNKTVSGWTIFTTGSKGPVRLARPGRLFPAMACGGTGCRGCLRCTRPSHRRP